MKLRFFPSVLLFLSAYSPLSIIFLIQDYDFENNLLKHPEIVWPIFGVSVISCILMWASVSLLKFSTSPITIESVSNRSGELINYSIPYMISFFVMDLGSINLLLSFGFFMFIMYWLTLKTHNIFINPILAVMGYNLYDVRYKKNGREYERFFLVKGERLRKNERCLIAELSEQLFLVTERNPEE
ncbi:hypothetical protein JYT60_00140 [bacterium AH-315-C08]|nr:hypothetical protein [bacterium AH-315-C08]